MKKFKPRLAFNFYGSYDEIMQSLDDSEKVDLLRAILDVQFMRVYIDDIHFESKILALSWAAIKHSILKQLEGYCNSKSTVYKSLFCDSPVPSRVPSRVPSSKGKDKGKKKNNTTSDNVAADDFETPWRLHSDYLKTIKTESGNSRRNTKKSKTKERYMNLLKKYSHLTIMVYVRSSTLKFGTPEMYNLFGASLDEDLLAAINKQDDDTKNDVLNSSDKEFNNFMDVIGDIL